MTSRSQPPLPLSYRISHAAIGPLLKWLGLSCRHALELSSEQMDRTLSKSESFQLRMHLMMCGICRHLPAQFQGLRKLLKAACEHQHEDLPTDSIPEPSKVRITDHLKNINRKP